MEYGHQSYEEDETHAAFIMTGRETARSEKEATRFMGMIEEILEVLIAYLWSTDRAIRKESSSPVVVGQASFISGRQVPRLPVGSVV